MSVTTTAAERPRLEIGRVINRTVKVLLGQAPLLLTVGGVTVGLVALLFGVMRMTGVIQDTGGDLLAEFRGVPGENLVLGLAGLVFSGGAIHAVLAALRGKRVTIGQAFGACGRFFGKLFGIAFLTNLAVILGLLLFIVPGVILWTRWLVSPAVGVAEDRAPTDAMGRSAKLTEGNRFRIFLLGLIAGVLLILVAVLLGVIGAAIDAVLGLPDVILYGLAVPLATLLNFAVSYAGKAAVYDELLRIREAGGTREVAEVFA